MVRSAGSITIGLLSLCAVVVIIGRTPVGEAAQYDELLALFSDWRQFQQRNDVPDYSTAAMAKQHRELASYRQRLLAIDPSALPIPQQVDWHLVRAEMNGLDFDHRVLRPWANNPAFYVTVFGSQSDQPSREGPHASGAVEIWKYSFPLSPEAAAEMSAGLRAVPPLLEQATRNLVGTGQDLWRFGIESLREQSATLKQLESRLGDATAALQADARAAKEATDRFVAWLETQAPSRTGPSGVGVENYDWYLKHVQLVPFTWKEQVTLMERELARSRAFLALEERRNAGLPEQVPISDAAEYERRFNEGVSRYMAFLEERDILSVRDYMDPALRARVGRFRPGPREFFTEVNHRDPLVMRTHDYHWFDLARLEAEPHPDPVRRGPLLYNIFITRTEGLATGWEEMMLQAGLFDEQPRSRELVYVLLAQRAARALGDLRMHANEFTLEEAAQFASANTPRGWLRLDGRTVWGEQHLYLQQPSYGTSYVIGKLQIENLLATRRRQLKDSFTLRGFMDELEATGLIPISLATWEMTGEMPSEIERVLTARP